MIFKHSVLRRISETKEVIADYERIAKENLIAENREFAVERIAELKKSLAGLELLLPTAVEGKGIERVPKHMTIEKAAFSGKMQKLGVVQKLILDHLLKFGETSRDDLCDVVRQAGVSIRRGVTTSAYGAINGLYSRDFVEVRAQNNIRDCISKPLMVKLTKTGIIKAESFNSKDRL